MIISNKNDTNTFKNIIFYFFKLIKIKKIIFHKVFLCLNSLLSPNERFFYLKNNLRFINLYYIITIILVRLHLVYSNLKYTTRYFLFFNL